MRPPTNGSVTRSPRAIGIISGCRKASPPTSRHSGWAMPMATAPFAPIHAEGCGGGLRGHRDDSSVPSSIQRQPT